MLNQFNQLSNIFICLRMIFEKTPSFVRCFFFAVHFKEKKHFWYFVAIYFAM